MRALSKKCTAETLPFLMQSVLHLRLVVEICFFLSREILSPIPPEVHIPDTKIPYLRQLTKGKKGVIYRHKGPGRGFKIAKN